MNKFHKSSPGRDGRWNRSLRHFHLDTATARINIDDPTVEIPPPTILQSYLCESLRLFSLLVSVSGQCIQRCIRYVLLLNYRRVWKFVVLLVFCRRCIHKCMVHVFESSNDFRFDLCDSMISRSPFKRWKFEARKPRSKLFELFRDTRKRLIKIGKKIFK